MVLLWVLAMLWGVLSDYIEWLYPFKWSKWLTRYFRLWRWASGGRGTWRVVVNPAPFVVFGIEHIFVLRRRLRYCDSLEDRPRKRTKGLQKGLSRSVQRSQCILHLTARLGVRTLAVVDFTAPRAMRARSLRLRMAQYRFPRAIFLSTRLEAMPREGRISAAETSGTCEHGKLAARHIAPFKPRLASTSPFGLLSEVVTQSSLTLYRPTRLDTSAYSLGF